MRRETQSSKFIQYGRNFFQLLYQNALKTSIVILSEPIFGSDVAFFVF